MANITDFTEKQFEDRLEKNVERLTKNRLAVESPTAFLLGGQPGSGKTSLRSAISEETQGNVVIIDNDTFKQQHPNFDELVKLYEKDVVKHATSYSNQLVKLENKGFVQYGQAFFLCFATDLPHLLCKSIKDRYNLILCFFSDVQINFCYTTTSRMPYTVLNCF